MPFDYSLAEGRFEQGPRSALLRRRRRRRALRRAKIQIRQLAGYAVLLAALVGGWLLCIKTVLQVPTSAPSAAWTTSLETWATIFAFKGLWGVPALGVIAHLALLLRRRWIARISGAAALIWGAAVCVARFAAFHYH